MPKLSDYPGIENTLPDFADWGDVELVGAKNDATYNVTPLQIAQVAQDGMASDDATWPISSVDGLQDALDGKPDNAVSTDTGNVITAGMDGGAFLSGDLLLPEGPDLSAYATISYVDSSIAAIPLSTYATNERVDALEVEIATGLASVNDALEGI